MMRCILVRGANLKADMRCACCQKKIGDTYAREIGTRLMYCDYDCYRNAAEEAAAVARNFPLPVNTWTVNS